MTRKQKKALCRILVSLALLTLAAVIPSEGWLRLVLFLIPYAVIGWKVLYDAVRPVLRGQMLDENFLMAIATVGAFCVGEYTEGVAVMLFYQVGELFESYAVGKSRRSIANLMDIRPDHANLETEDGVQEVDPEEVPPGSVILIKPGERVPLDGVVLEGRTTLNTAALTGESLPRDVQIGDEVISGCVNASLILWKMRAAKRRGWRASSRALQGSIRLRWCSAPRCLRWCRRCLTETGAAGCTAR